MDTGKDPALGMVLAYTALVLGFSVLYWLLITLAQRGSLPFAMGPPDFSLEKSSVPGLLCALGLRSFGPALAAILTLYFFQGRAGLAGLWRSLTFFRLPISLYALAVFAPLALSALIAALGLYSGRLQYAADQLQPLRFAAFFPLMLIFDGPLGEEPGWRGLLLPRLLARMGPVAASSLVGLVWFVWHLPLYLADGRDLHPLSYLVNVVALSYVFTWFYIKSGRSTWMTVFLHATSNYALFLIIKSFHYTSADVAHLQRVYDAALVIAAFVVAWDLRRMGTPKQV
ncbi:MAG TPA: CPBP family intramembrane glutamic endopeptidase [Steroidobacteraceae bacterium]|nr:CPBP family intramembrane glutamic endopeptidase [Steroidobacteraceae bacterium]